MRWQACRKYLRGDDKLYIEYVHADNITVCLWLPNVSYFVRKIPLPFRVITVSKGYSIWKKKHEPRDWDLVKDVNVNCECLCIFCWGTELIAAWKVFLSKDFGRMTIQIPASVWSRVDKLVFNRGFIPACIQKCWFGKFCPKCQQW